MDSVEDKKLKIRASVKKAQQELRKRTLLKKLNEGFEFKRFPYARVVKYNISYDKDSKTYFFDKNH